MTNTLPKKILKPISKNELIQIIKDEIKFYNDNCDLNHIDTSLITDMSDLFSKDNKLDKFNGDISRWKTSNVQKMQNMFSSSQFNGDISQWDTSSVVFMSSMFSHSQFNGDISQWNTSNVEFMDYMFYGSKFNQDISSWDTSFVAYMYNMFQFSLFNQDISIWNVSSVIDMSCMFDNSKITKIPQWNYFKIETVTKMFDNCSELTEPLPDWYQFNYIKGFENRKKTFDDCLKSKKLNKSISDNLFINSKKDISNKI